MVSLGLALLLYVFYFVLGADIQYGIQPRTLDGLTGIITSIVIHTSFSHIFFNSLGFTVLTYFILKKHPKHYMSTFFISLTLTGILVWLFAKSGSHVGISGIVYAFSTFVIINSVITFNRDVLVSGIVAAIVMLMIYSGAQPIDDGTVSWESHFFGIIAGLFSSINVFKYS